VSKRRRRTTPGKKRLTSLPSSFSIALQRAVLRTTCTGNVVFVSLRGYYVIVLKDYITRGNDSKTYLFTGQNYPTHSVSLTQVQISLRRLCDKVSESLRMQF